MKKEDGWLTVIKGAMKSGKSDESIRRKILAEKYGNMKGIAFNPSINIRNGKSVIASYSGLEIPAISIDIENPEKIVQILQSRKYRGYKLLIISEIQFFKKNIAPVIVYLLKKGYKIIAEGLGLDHQGQIFGDGVVYLLSEFANETVNLKAYCECAHESHIGGLCGSSDGVFSALKLKQGVDKEGRIFIGREEYYICCLKCFFEHYENRFVEPENQIIFTKMFPIKKKKTKTNSKKSLWHRLAENNPYPDPRKIPV